MGTGEKNEGLVPFLRCGNGGVSEVPYERRADREGAILYMRHGCRAQAAVVRTKIGDIENRI